MQTGRDGPVREPLGDQAVAVVLAFVAVTATVPLVSQAAPSQQSTLEWTNGTFEAGLSGAGQALWPEGVPAPDHQRYELPVSPCHRELSLGLEYEPRNASATVRAGGNLVHASVPFRFRAGLFTPNGTLMHRIVVEEPDLSINLGVAPEAGNYTLELELLEGALVDYSVRVRGQHRFLDDPTCDLWLNEVETNPPGQDAGGEWVELYNAGSQAVNVSGWKVRGVHGSDGVGVFEIPNGTTVEAGDHERVGLKGDAYLANANETVELFPPSGGALDASVPLDDAADGPKTWQKAGDGLGDWIFARGTPAGPNVE